MKNKFLAILLATALMVGCAGNTDTPTPSTSTPNTNVPSENQQSVVMATVDGTDVLFGDFADYINITEEMARLIAQENMAFCEMIRMDLQNTEQGFDQEAFVANVEGTAGVELDQIMAIEEMANTIDLVCTTAGITKEQYHQAAMLDYTPTLLTDMMNQHIYMSSNEDPELFMKSMEEYSAGFTTRTDFTDSSVLAKIDGEDFPITDEYRMYFDYSGLMARSNAIHTISLNKALYDSLVEKGMEVSEEGFAEHKEQVMAMFAQDEVYQILMPKALESLGMTEEDYNAALDPYLALSYGSSFMDIAIRAEYETLAEDARPETAELYVQEIFTNLSQNTVITNLK